MSANIRDSYFFLQLAFQFSKSFIMISSISPPELSRLQGTTPPRTAPPHRLPSDGLEGRWGWRPSALRWKPHNLECSSIFPNALLGPYSSNSHTIVPLARCCDEWSCIAIFPRTGYTNALTVLRRTQPKGVRLLLRPTELHIFPLYFKYLMVKELLYLFWSSPSSSPFIIL